MKKLIPYFPAIIIILLLVAAVATTLNDFSLPGSQVGQSGNIETPDKCDNCHGGYDQAIEPAFNWRGSMMSQAARDPLFYACLAVANQDAPGVGDMCLRCHTPDGWLNGRCDPTDGSALNNNDRQGVQCDFCHKMVKPSPLGVNPFPLDGAYTSTAYGSGTYTQDQTYLKQIIPIPGTPTGGIYLEGSSSANGMYIADANNAKRGPFTDATGRHQMFYSPFHSTANHCGTCHDVSNPVYSRQGDGTYMPNSFNAPHPTQNLRDMFPVERTYSEWKASKYSNPNTADYKNCQFCHMKGVPGKAAKMNDAVVRNNMPLHDMTGGNTFTPKMVKQKWAAEVNAAALDAGITRSQAQLKGATSMDLTVSGTTATVKVTNNTGHKFPTGYPEGRRAWIHLIAKDALGTTYESGAYNVTDAQIIDPEHTKIYHCEPGMTAEIIAASGVKDVPEPGPTFHFALNNKIYFDNRIPPAGATSAKLAEMQSPAVGYAYGDNQNWDLTTYTLPFTPVSVVAELKYQTTTKEYVEFLRLNGGAAGEELYNLWTANGKSAPEVINSATWSGGTEPVPNDVLASKFNSAITKTTSTKTGTSASVEVLVTLNGNPVSGATVNASYTGPTTGVLTVTTLSGGIARLTTKSVKNVTGTWCFTVSSVTYNNITIKPLIKICEGETPKAAAIPGVLAQAGLNIYPNPSFGKARIDYTVAQPGLTRIAMYNNLGQQVTLLVNKYLEDGEYSAEWNGSGYPDGVYICRMTAGNQVISKTLILKK
jgi:hypothetical protein